MSAVRWFLRFRDVDSPPLAPGELQAWERFAAEPRHRQELAEVNEIWRAVQTLGGPKMPSEAELSADEFDGSISINEWHARNAGKKRAPASWLSRPARLQLMAAGLAAAVIGATFYFQLWSHWSSREQVQAFATPRAEQRAVTLVDGSVVTLGARTEIHTRITATERTIVLDRGEAWFNVAHERQRPFKVLAGGGVITALGTEFNVRRDFEGEKDRVTVTVGEGLVKVEPRRIASQNSMSKSATAEPGSMWQMAQLRKGQEVIYDNAKGRSGIRSADVTATAAWKEGRLEYIHQPLSAVVASINRYSEKSIALADESVGELDYSGTVFEGQIDEWVRALRTAFPVFVTETNDRILIQSSPP